MRGRIASNAKFSQRLAAWACLSPAVRQGAAISQQSQCAISPAQGRENSAPCGQPLRERPRMKKDDFIFKPQKPPHDSSEWIAIRVAIRKNDTGEVREYDDIAIWDDGPCLHIWEDGNFSCDCNRYLFFQRVAGEDEDDDKCGDGAYSVNIYNPKDGSVLYEEFKRGPSRNYPFAEGGIGKP
jgi:hypothetical protein